MPSFSGMFPTYARFFSNIGNLVVLARNRTRAVGLPVQVSHPGYIKGEEPDVAGHAPQEPPQAPLGETAGSRPPAELNAVETQILQMYQSWVELDKGVSQAHEDLQRILNSRGKSAMLRSQAQETLDQGETLREEAQRIGKAAWQAFDRGFATNLTGFARRRAMVREIDQSRRTQAELQRNIHKMAWEEAEMSRDAATTQVLKALNALAIVAAQVEKELAEAANLPKLAETLKESAQEELRCAGAVKDELLLLGREALNQLGLTPTSDHEYLKEEFPSRETGISPLETGISPLETQGSIGDDGGLESDPGPQPLIEDPVTLEQMSVQPPADSDADSISWDAVEHSAPSAMEKPETDELPAVVIQPASPVIQPPPAPPITDAAISEPLAPAQDLIIEMEEGRAFVQSSQSTATPGPETTNPERSQPQTPLEGEIVPPQDDAAALESPPAKPPPPAAGKLSAADLLIRDMEAARIAAQPFQSPPDSGIPKAGQDLIRDPRAFRSPPAGVPQPVSHTPASAAGKPPEAAYSELLYLMFPSTLTQDEVGLVWEAMEDAARGSRILDTRLLSASEGIQFTVQLGAAGLLTGDLINRLSGAELEGLGPGRLKVNWPKG